jgi:hypothetical protein
MLFLAPYHVSALSGKAAIVVGQKNVANSCKLIVVYVQNNVVTRADTILRNGTFYRSRWSFDGRRIAFYRNGYGVCIIDADGKNLRCIAPMINWTEIRQEQTMDWPGIDAGK